MDRKWWFYICPLGQFRGESSRTEGIDKRFCRENHAGRAHSGLVEMLRSGPVQPRSHERSHFFGRIDAAKIYLLLFQQRVFSALFVILSETAWTLIRMGVPAGKECFWKKRVKRTVGYNFILSAVKLTADKMRLLNFDLRFMIGEMLVLARPHPGPPPRRGRIDVRVWCCGNVWFSPQCPTRCDRFWGWRAVKWPVLSQSVGICRNISGG